MISEFKAFPAFFYDKCRNSSGSDIRGGHGEYYVRVCFRRIRYEYLSTIQQVIITLQYGSCLGSARIRACVGFGEAECAYFLPLCQRRQILPLLFLRAEGENRPGTKGYMCGKNDSCPAVHSGQLLHRDCIAEHIQPGAAVFLGIWNPHQSHFPQLLYRFRWKFIILIHQKRYWFYFAFRELPHFLSERFMLLCCLIKHT